MRLLALQILLAICGFIAGVFLLGVLLGDSDDHFWWHGLVGTAPTFLLYRHLHSWHLSRRVSRTLQIALGIVTGALLLESITGFFSSSGLVSGRRYEGMDGVIPILLGIASIIPVSAALIIRCIPERQSSN
jgi:hypothetical protein